MVVRRKNRKKVSGRNTVKKREVSMSGRVQKRRTKKSVKKQVQKSVLREALSDISKEINRLKRERASLVVRIDGIEKSILNSQNKENTLRDKITRLVQQESTLNKRKGATQSDLLRLKEKLDKVKKIQQEIREV